METPFHFIDRLICGRMRCDAIYLFIHIMLNFIAHKTFTCHVYCVRQV